VGRFWPSRDPQCLAAPIEMLPDGGQRAMCFIYFLLLH
jgi:hypothetical protein